MKKNKKILLLSSLLLLLVFNSLGVFALESDSEQPMDIDSDTATYDDVTATSTYIGNVISTQGSLRVNSDKLVVYFKDGEVDELVFTGNKAKFKQTPNEGDEDITGEALTGKFYPKKNLLVLIDDAIVWQGNGTYSSNLIQYNSKTSLVTAGEQSSVNKRVHVTLQPKAKGPGNTPAKPVAIETNNKATKK